MLPIPSDTIVGLYHPFRDLFAKSYPNGIPFKNFLLTDPVRQLIPWKSFAISVLKDHQLPLWNPYNGAGTPLLANFQSGIFYPLNIIFFLFHFLISWTIFLMLQPVLAGLFLYFYLRNLKLEKWSSIFGSFIFAFSGFSIAWMEWGNVLHTALWLPLILLCKDKLLKKFSGKWAILLIFAECSALFAGHLQTWFYMLLISNVYLFYRIFQQSKKDIGMIIKTYTPFLLLGALILIIGAVQLVPTFHFILQSARSLDQNMWQQPGWFVPWQNLIQFFAPDFFGNPATLNYWGVWNYAELVGYIGILPLIFALFATIFSKHKEKFFFVIITVIAFLFALPTFIAKLPFQFNIPFLSTSQPTRLLFVVDFCLSILAAMGFDSFLAKRNKAILWVFAFVGLVLLATFGITYHSHDPNLLVAQHNLYFPFGLFVISLFTVLFSILIKRRKVVFALLFLAITIFDLFRFGWKFLPFSSSDYFFPKTEITNFLQENAQNYRVMTTDSRIFPPNFSIMYQIQTLDLYDPLYLKNYAELIAASERGKPNISGPFGFNRIITPHNYSSNIVNLLGVKYILSFDQIKASGYKKVVQEGQTIIYENQNVFPRTFFVENVMMAKNNQEDIEKMFSMDLHKTAIVQKELNSQYSVGSAQMLSYSPNKVIIKTQNNGQGFLVLTDVYYSTWQALIDGKKTDIIPTDYDLRGVIVPSGSHTVEFVDRLF